MDILRSVLVAGTGPTAVQLAVLFKRWRNSRVGLAGRRSVRSAPFFDALRQSGGTVAVDASDPKLEALGGQYAVDAFFLEYMEAEGSWETLILSVTADAYVAVLAQLPPELLRSLRCVALLSPTFGSNSLVSHYLKNRGCTAEVLSFSTYLGDTRRTADRQPNRVLTTAVKRKVYAGASHSCSESLESFRFLYKDAGIALETMDSALDAETRNISLYVHPPLFMNDFSLGAIFGQPALPKYVYKLFPEGPITGTLISEMLSQWKEISALVGTLGAQPLNLLQFMVDDNYPIRPESISRNHIDDFAKLDPIHQQYLLYIRYASLLIDPYSEPNREGRYFDFSAVPLRSVFVNHEDEWDIPRMPKEDDYRLKIIQGIARSAGVPCPTIDRFVARYDQAVEEAAKRLSGSALSEAFRTQSFEADIEQICSELLPARSL
ncbi:MAG: hypothetical protein K0Q63_2219 [Paenibacillus sp.]|nr:hypothetical protein [Paenibacillus sp.]